jgi:aminopeptidase N
VNLLFCNRVGRRKRDELPNAINEAIISGFPHPTRKKLLARMSSGISPTSPGCGSDVPANAPNQRWSACSPAWAVDEATVQAADAWLADDHPPALRHLVSEGRAGIVRALAAREFDRS